MMTEAPTADSSRSLSAPPANEGPAAPASRANQLAAYDSPDSAAQGQKAGGASSGSSSVVEAVVPRLDRMIAATVNMTVSVQDAVQAARAAERVADRFGGFVGSSNVRDVDAVREASLTLRIPQPNLVDALAELRGLGSRVTAEAISTQDVTEEYTDVESSIRNLQATEAQLLRFMERAGKMEEVLTLQRELTGVRGQIERIEGRRRVLDSKTSYATVTLRLVEPVAARAGWSITTTLEHATTALSGIAQGLTTALIWLLVFLPIYGPAWLAVWWIVRRRPSRVQTPETATASSP
jgi:hypothetical protein